ncbi:MAG: shikimate dehydrogenase [Chlorobiales bacterium]|nr:shikimate dehydrogenase [Chlorobiales bacterium]
MTGVKKILGLLGHQINYSLSPLMHNTAAEHLGLDYYYTLFNVNSPDDLPAVFDGMRALGIAGFNVTIPYKEKVIRYLDQLSPAAAEVQAVNTVINQDGTLIGDNTDIEGFFEPIQSYKQSIKGHAVAIFGSGGVTRAAIESLKTHFEPGAIHLFVRNLTKGEELRNDIKRRSKYLNLEVHYSDEPESLTLLRSCQLIINATPIGTLSTRHGAHDKPDCIIPLESNVWTPSHIAYDLVYNPPMTPFLMEAQKHGATIVSGLEMLIAQGQRSFKLWTGHDMPVDVVREALQKKLAELAEENGSK